jgi:hypothetical protein
MLAKQGWNIMIKPESLVARMLKASIFPNPTFLDSHLGHNLSYLLRTIWFSRHILANGCTWRIGDGTKARVMHDLWLRIPVLVGYLPCSPKK